MHPRKDPSDLLLSVATKQAGVIHADQALLDGLGHSSIARLVRQRHWKRLVPGLYLIGVIEPPWLAYAWAGILLGGDRARLGFEAAGHLWGLLEEEPDELRVLVPWPGPVVNRPPWRFQRERTGVRSTASPGSPQRTTLEDTTIDLCGEASPARVHDLLTRAVQSHRTTAEQLRACADRRSRLGNRKLIHDVLGPVSEGAQSPLELKYLADVERAHGLPRAGRQHRSRRGPEVRDMLYEEFGVIVELDGTMHIVGRFRDMQRDNSALLAGELTLRYGWPDVAERPCQVARQVAGLLVARGWAGLPTRCPRCALANETDLWLSC
jgi:very-short-patch-repair endonuclease